MGTTRHQEPFLWVRLLLLITATTLLISAAMTLIVGRLVASTALEIGASNLRAGLERLVDNLAAAEGPEAVALLVEDAFGHFKGVRWQHGPGESEVPVTRAQGQADLLGEAAELLVSENLAHRVSVRNKRVFVAARLSTGDLFALEYRPDGEVQRAWLVPAAALASALLSAMLFATFLARPMQGRLCALGEVIDRYGDGDKGVRLPEPERRHELSQVHAAFNAMANRIAQLEASEEDRRRRHGALLTGLAHDINTPLTVIRGNAEVLLDHTKLDAGQSRMVSELVTQSLYVQALVDDLLTLAREKGQHLPLARQSLRLDDLIDSLVDTFEPAASRRGVALFGDGCGLRVQADPTRLRQMLTNLVRNALLHARGASSLEIQAAPVDGALVLRVEDDGPGVPEAEIPQLFQEFRRGKDPDTEGFGLGLATVQLLAGLHGGEVRYLKGHDGACFEIRLPNAVLDSEDASPGSGGIR